MLPNRVVYFFHILENFQFVSHNLVMNNLKCNKNLSQWRRLSHESIRRKHLNKHELIS